MRRSSRDVMNSTAVTEEQKLQFCIHKEPNKTNSWKKEQNGAGGRTQRVTNQDKVSVLDTL